MSPRPLAVGWLAVGWLVAHSSFAQAPAASAPTAAAAAAAASAPARPASAAAPAAAAASTPAAPVPASAASAAPASASASASGSASASASPSASAPKAASAPAAKASARKPRKAPARAASAPAAKAPSPEATLQAIESAAHERELEAIRNALVETAVAAPVRVQSFGWIDDQGRLHESTQFTSDARVRGVRVESYLRDPDAPPPPPPKVMVDVESLPVGVGRRADDDPRRCLDRNGRWRQTLQLEVAVEGRPGASGQPGEAMARRMAAAVEPMFLEAARQSRRWAVQPRPYQPATAYERALLGREADRTDWMARLVLAPQGSYDIVAQLEVSPVGHPGRARRIAWRMPSAEARPVDWAAGIAALVEALDRETACEPLWFAVQGSGTSFRLREGGSHGLQPGDRLLMVPRQHLAGRLLEPGATRALALLQVEAGGGTALRWLAGARPAADGGDWVALPL